MSVSVLFDFNSIFWIPCIKLASVTPVGQTFGVCLIKIRSKHSSVLLLYLLQIFMRQTLFTEMMNVL